MIESKEIKDYCFEFSEYLDKKISDRVVLKSGYESLDSIIGGFFRGKVYTIGARTGKGKTTLLTNIAFNNATSSRVLFFSTEISVAEFTERLISLYSGIPVFDFHTKIDALYDRLILEELEKLKSCNIIVNDSATPGIGLIISEIKKYTPQLVIVDYLGQIFFRPSENVPRAVSDLMRGLKTVARTYNIPIIVASQLNRAVEYRGGKPVLADLKDSGGIEESSDVVLLIDGLEDNMINISVAKSRYSGTGAVQLSFKKENLKVGGASKYVF